MKKILSILITISVVLSSLYIPIVADAATLTSGDFTYRIINNSIEITKCKDKNKTLEIPSEINGLKVTSIGESAFNGMLKLKVVTLPDTIKSIGESAFCSCINLKTVNLGKGIIRIKSESFADCNNLSNINFPSSLTSIGKMAFFSSGIREVKLGKNVKTIGSKAFSDTLKLKKFTVSKSNKYFSSQKGVLYNKKKTKLIKYPVASKRKTFTVPKTVKTICTHSFYWCKNLKKVKLNKNLRTIGNYAFFYNKNLESINLPEKLKTIGENAFSVCKKLKSITIPQSVTFIKYEAFDGCIGVKKLKINANKNLKVDTWAFRCIGIEKLTMPKLKYSGGALFQDCFELKEVVIPDNVTKIREFTFEGCGKLKTVTIPKSVKKIGRYSFGYSGGFSENYPRIKGFTIKGYKGTAAEKYAKKNYFKFVAID